MTPPNSYNRILTATTSQLRSQLHVAFAPSQLRLRSCNLTVAPLQLQPIGSGPSHARSQLDRRRTRRCARPIASGEIGGLGGEGGAARAVVMASTSVDYMTRNIDACSDKLFLEAVDGCRVKQIESIDLAKTCIPPSWFMPSLAVPAVGVFDDTHTRRGVDMLPKGITPSGDACLVCAGM